MNDKLSDPSLSYHHPTAYLLLQPSQSSLSPLPPSLFVEQIFTEAGVISIEHADFDGIERLAAVTGT